MRYVFKITLTGLSEPKVWRRVAIPGSYTFFKFHRVIQLVFGWENLHFFEFTTNPDNKEGLHICMPHIDELENVDFTVTDATGTKIENVINENVKHIEYLYDHNDNWIHDIQLESVDNVLIERPVCLDGEGMCPPEGCGGVQGYEHIKFILKERPDSDEARRCREWLFMEEDDIFDPSYFPKSEIEDINDIMKR